MPPKAVLLLTSSLAALLPLPSCAENSCATAFEPKTSGFALNPILDRLTVTSARPSKAGDVCPLQIHDEILKVNQQVVPGTRALRVMRYWKSIEEGSVVTYVIKRNGAVLTVTAK